MKVERLDHVFIKTNDMNATADAMEKITGEGSFIRFDMTEAQGNIVGFAPPPLGLEILQGTAEVGTGPYTIEAEPGLFALSFKVADYEGSLAEMEALGYKKLWEGEFGDIKEALFDTKEVFGFLIQLASFEGEDVTAVDNGGLS